MYELPVLPYHFSELEPAISADIVKVHYERHHAGYVAKLNDALQKADVARKNGDIAEYILTGGHVHFNGGGHVNHCLYWENLLPQSKGGGVLSDGPLRERIVDTFGSFERCIEIVTQVALSIQGSGWAWLGYCTQQNHVRAIATDKHDLTQTQQFLPILCIDLWEHAYYLQYKNDRAAYLRNIWSIINWNKVEERFCNACS